MALQHLQTVADRDAERAQMSPAERLYAKSIEPKIIQIARGVDARGRDRLVRATAFVTSDSRQAEAVLVVLTQKAAGMIVVKEGATLPEGGDVLVYFYKQSPQGLHEMNQGNWFAAVARRDAIDGSFIGKTAYIFRSADFPRDPYMGMRFWDIQTAVATEDRGKESSRLQQLERVIKLIRSLLYEQLDPPQLISAQRELKRLLLSVGPAARAVIADFQRDYHDNEGLE